MAFKPKQLDPTAAKVFSEGEVGMLIESIDGKLDLLLEGQQSIRDDLKGIKADHRRLGERVDHLEVRVDTIETRQP